MPTSSEVVAQTERALLGSVLLDNSLWPKTAELSTEDFSLDSHRRIYRCMARMAEDQRPVDLVTLTAELSGSNQLEGCGGAAYLSSLLDPAYPENFDAYTRMVHESSVDRRFARLQERPIDASTKDERLSIVGQMLESLTESNQSENWRGLFHAHAEFENAPTLQFAIDGFLQEGGITLIGGLAGQGKTLVMLSMVKSLLESTALFGYFRVPNPTSRVLYLIPESTIGPFWARIKLFRLEEHVRSDRLLVRTLSSKEQVPLDNPRLLKAAEGADVFLDTAVRFMDGAEDAENSRVFANTLFRLLRAGARTIVGAHHAPKGFEGQEYMMLENILRGSGDIGAMLCTAWGIRQIDAESNRLYVQNVKPRDFQPCPPFVLEGRPHLDLTGQFKMLEPPGDAAGMRSYVRSKGGRTETTDKANKQRQAVDMRAKGCSIREIARTIGVSSSTIDRWLFDFDASQNSVPRRTVSGQQGNRGRGELEVSPPSRGFGTVLSHDSNV